MAKNNNLLYGLGALAGGSLLGSVANAFSAPSFEAPTAYIDAAAIDRLIGLARTQGLSTLQQQTAAAKQTASAAMSGQGMWGTGGIPAQLLTSISNESATNAMGLETDLASQKFGLLKYLQDYNLEVAKAQYTSDANKFSTRSDIFSGLTDLTGSAFLGKLFGAF